MEKKIILNVILIIVTVTILSPMALAASQIEIIPTQKGMRDVTVSTSFVTCRNLDSTTSTLGTTGLDPHLVTNLDWGAVSYLTNSNYGVGANGHTIETQGRAGKKITVTENIGGSSTEYTYYSTTGNATGIMNWGANPNEITYTQTAGILNTATEQNTNTNYEKVKILLKYKTSKYVENLTSVTNTVGMAINETISRPNWTGIYGWNNFQSNNEYPIIIRTGIFGFTLGNPGGNYGTWSANTSFTSGGADSKVTFRPVIWNISD